MKEKKLHEKKESAANIDSMLEALSETTEKQKGKEPLGFKKLLLRLLLGKNYEQAIKNHREMKGEEHTPFLLRLKGALKSRALRHGSVMVFLIAVFMTVIILINILAGILSEQYPLLSIDLTSDGRYSLSESTTSILESLTEPVTIDILAKESDCKSSDPSVDPYGQIPLAHELICRYAAYSDYISIRYVDLTRTPGYLQQYPEFSDLLGQYSIVVGSPHRTRVTSFYEMLPSLSAYYITDDSEENDVSSSFTETMLTSLIKTVSLDYVPVVAYLDGLEGDRMVSYLLNILDLNGYDVKSVDFRTEEIPSEADIAVIASPMRDINLTQAAKLEDWLENNGKLSKTLLVFASPLMPDCTNLNDFLNDWGLGISSKVVYEGAPSYVLPGQPESYFFTQYFESEYTGDLADRSISCAVASANLIERVFETQGKFVTNPILSSSASGYVCDADTEFDVRNFTGSDMAYRPVMVSATKYAQDINGYELRSDVVAAPASLFDGDLLNSSAYGNGSLLMTLCNERTGLGDATIDIEAKYLSTIDFSVETDTIKVLTAVFSFVIPALLLLGGLIVFIRRRYL